jgi:hypothetical protein
MTCGKPMVASLVCLICCTLLLGCTTTQHRKTEEAGWYGISTGWNESMGDVNGEVGHRMYVGGPRGKCLPSRSWSSSQRIVSGSLPPGLSMDGTAAISGVPTERGHWIVNLELSNITCEGKTYRDYSQELRFHVTGTGRVIQ